VDQLDGGLAGSVVMVAAHHMKVDEIEKTIA
jgi:hypothetical protein